MELNRLKQHEILPSLPPRHEALHHQGSSYQTPPPPEMWTWKVTCATEATVMELRPSIHLLIHPSISIHLFNNHPFTHPSSTHRQTWHFSRCPYLQPPASASGSLPGWSYRKHVTQDPSQSDSCRCLYSCWVTELLSLCLRGREASEEAFCVSALCAVKTSLHHSRQLNQSIWQSSLSLFLRLWVRPPEILEPIKRRQQLIPSKSGPCSFIHLQTWKVSHSILKPLHSKLPQHNLELIAQ